MKPSTAIALWRSAVVVLALIAGIQTAIELSSAPRVLTPGVRGETLFSGRYLRERGPTTFVVDALPPGSPLIAEGVQPGDRIRYDHPLGRWYNLVAGDKLTLTALRGDESRRVEVTVPGATNMPGFVSLTYVIGAITNVLSIVLGVFIGWRRADSTAFRALSASALMAALPFPYSAPEAIHVPWLDFLASVTQGLFAGVLVFFALNYPDDRPVGVRATLKRVYPWLFAVLVVAMLIYFSRLYAGQFEPVSWVIFRIAEIVQPVLFFAGLVLGWRQAHGEARIRFQWMLATIGALVVVVLIGNLSARFGRPISDDVFNLVMSTTVLTVLLGFIYAIFRYQVVDFEFAVNRVLVYGAATTILLLAFFALEKLAEHYLHSLTRQQSALLDGGLALGVFLFFHRVRHWVEHHLERIFFRKWHDNEEALKGFVRQAEHITKPGALIAAATGEIDRFTGGAGNATYRRTSDGSFERAASTLDGAPTRVDADDPLPVALRSNRGVTKRGETRTSLPGAVAFPMSHRAELDGFVVAGDKRNNEIYRPDEIELLAFAVNQVGLDLHALDAEAYRREAAVLRERNDEMRSLVGLALRRPAEPETVGTRPT